MKTKTVIAFIFIAVFNGVATSAQNKAATDRRLQLDVSSSKIYWKGPKSIGHKHHGQLLFLSGTITQLGKGSCRSADFTIDMNSIRTDDNDTEKEKGKTNAMLKGDDFFAVAKYPTGKIQINEIKPTSTVDEYKVMGYLTLKGIRQPIQLLATIKNGGQTITATAAMKIDRNRWGINSKKSSNTFSFVKDKLIADEIPITFKLVFK